VLVLSVPERVEEVLGALRERYYEPRGLTEPPDDHLFVAEPSAGATVTPLS
jgi:hypothetical protein